MPAGYEKMRDKFHAQGMGLKAAKGKAARIWNAKHKSNPVTRSHKSERNREEDTPEPEGRNGFMGLMKAASERLSK